MAKNDTAHDYPSGVAHLLPPVHPGSVLADEMQARGLTSNSLALALRVPANRISAIVRGQRGMTAETALRLGRYLGTGAQFWINLQVAHDIALAAVAELHPADRAMLETFERTDPEDAEWR